MNKKQNLTILLATVIMMISLVCGTAFAKQPAPPPPTPVPICGGLTGTWHGEEANDMRWLALHTSDSLDPTKGEMLMNWIYINPSLIGSEYSLTPGHGVWQINSDDTYNFTWYAYAIGPESESTPPYIVRVSGVASFNPENPDDCDTIYISYEFAGSSDVGVVDLKSANFNTFVTGKAVQTRVPMVVPPLPLQ